MRLHTVEELCNHRCHANEVAWPRSTFQRLGHGSRLHCCPESTGIHGLYARGVHRDNACRLEHLEVARFIPGIGTEVLALPKLRRIHKEARRGHVVLFHAPRHQRHVAIVEVPHSRHQAHLALQSCAPGPEGGRRSKYLQPRVAYASEASLSTFGSTSKLCSRVGNSLSSTSPANSFSASRMVAPSVAYRFACLNGRRSS